MSSLCDVQHSPSAWAGFKPKLTATLTVAPNKNPALDLILDLCQVLAGPLEHGCATKQHDIGARALVGAIVELHDVLQRLCCGFGAAEAFCVDNVDVLSREFTSVFLV